MPPSRDSFKGWALISERGEERQTEKPLGTATTQPTEQEVISLPKFRPFPTSNRDSGVGTPQVRLLSTIKGTLPILTRLQQQDQARK